MKELDDCRGHIGATVTRMPDGGVLIWYASGPERAIDVPMDMLEVATENEDDFYHWLTYWHNGFKEEKNA